MNGKPKIVYILVLLWLALSAIFISWGWYSLSFILRIQSPGWEQWLADFTPQVHLGYLISTIVWFVFSALFILFAYGTFRKEHWVWTTGLIISTIFLVVFGLMLGAFMVNAVVFLDSFSVAGLVTVIITFITDIGIVFFLTRPDFKLYFGIS